MDTDDINNGGLTGALMADHSPSVSGSDESTLDGLASAYFRGPAAQSGAPGRPQCPGHSQPTPQACRKACWLVLAALPHVQALRLSSGPPRGPAAQPTYNSGQRQLSLALPAPPSAPSEASRRLLAQGRPTCSRARWPGSGSSTWHSRHSRRRRRSFHSFGPSPPRRPAGCRPRSRPRWRTCPRWWTAGPPPKCWGRPRW